MHEIAGFIKTNTQYFGVSSLMSDVCFQFTTYVKKQNKKKQPFQLNRKYVCLKCKKKKKRNPDDAQTRSPGGAALAAAFQH